MFAAHETTSHEQKCGSLTFVSLAKGLVSIVCSMRVLVPSNAMFATVERSPWFGFVGVLTIAAAFIALRVYCAFTLSMNSDEPQHLHVVWAWTQGLVPYRDVFDNHAPLFQLICAPLLAWLAPLAIMDRLPARDVAFVEDNYVAVPPASELIYIAGQHLGSARAGVGVTFEVRVPADYAIVAAGGNAAGVLDGVELSGTRRLAVGRHVFVPSADSRLAVVWSPALQRGLRTGELFTANDR